LKAKSVRKTAAFNRHKAAHKVHKLALMKPTAVLNKHWPPLSVHKKAPMLPTNAPPACWNAPAVSKVVAMPSWLLLMTG